MASDFRIGDVEEDENMVMQDELAIQKLIRKHADLMNMAKEVDLETVLKEERKQKNCNDI